MATPCQKHTWVTPTDIGPVVPQLRPNLRDALPKDSLDGMRITFVGSKGDVWHIDMSTPLCKGTLVDVPPDLQRAILSQASSMEAVEQPTQEQISLDQDQEVPGHIHSRKSFPDVLNMNASPKSPDPLTVSSAWESLTSMPTSRESLLALNNSFLVGEDQPHSEKSTGPPSDPTQPETTNIEPTVDSTSTLQATQREASMNEEPRSADKKPVSGRPGSDSERPLSTREPFSQPTQLESAESLSDAFSPSHQHPQTGSKLPAPTGISQQQGDQLTETQKSEEESLQEPYRNRKSQTGLVLGEKLGETQILSPSPSLDSKEVSLPSSNAEENESVQLKQTQLSAKDIVKATQLSESLSDSEMIQPTQREGSVVGKPYSAADIKPVVGGMRARRRRVTEPTVDSTSTLQATQREPSMDEEPRSADKEPVAGSPGSDPERLLSPREPFSQRTQQESAESLSDVFSPSHQHPQPGSTLPAPTSISQQQNEQLTETQKSEEESVQDPYAYRNRKSLTGLVPGETLEETQILSPSLSMDSKKVSLPSSNAEDNESVQLKQTQLSAADIVKATPLSESLSDSEMIQPTQRERSVGEKPYSAADIKPVVGGMRARGRRVTEPTVDSTSTLQATQREASMDEEPRSADKEPVAGRPGSDSEHRLSAREPFSQRTQQESVESLSDVFSPSHQHPQRGSTLPTLTGISQQQGEQLTETQKSEEESVKEPYRNRKSLTGLLPGETLEETQILSPSPSLDSKEVSLASSFGEDNESFQLKQTQLSAEDIVKATPLSECLSNSEMIQPTQREGSVVEKPYSGADIKPVVGGMRARGRRENLSQVTQVESAESLSEVSSSSLHLEQPQRDSSVSTSSDPLTSNQTNSGKTEETRASKLEPRTDASQHYTEEGLSFPKASKPRKQQTSVGKPSEARYSQATEVWKLKDKPLREPGLSGSTSAEELEATQISNRSILLNSKEVLASPDKDDILSIQLTQSRLSAEEVEEATQIDYPSESQIRDTKIQPSQEDKTQVDTQVQLQRKESQTYKQTYQSAEPEPRTNASQQPTVEELSVLEDSETDWKIKLQPSQKDRTQADTPVKVGQEESQAYKQTDQSVEQEPRTNASQQLSIEELSVPEESETETQQTSVGKPAKERSEKSLREPHLSGLVTDWESEETQIVSEPIDSKEESFAPHDEEDSSSTQMKPTQMSADIEEATQLSAASECPSDSQSLQPTQKESHVAKELCHADQPSEETMPAASADIEEGTQLSAASECPSDSQILQPTQKESRVAKEPCHADQPCQNTMLGLNGTGSRVGHPGSRRGSFTQRTQVESSESGSEASFSSPIPRLERCRFRYRVRVWKEKDTPHPEIKLVAYISANK